MIIFIIFKLISTLYGLEKETVDIFSGIFVFFSIFEFVLVVIFVVAFFGQILEFLRSLKK